MLVFEESASFRDLWTFAFVEQTIAPSKRQNKQPIPCHPHLGLRPDSLQPKTQIPGLRVDTRI